MKAVNQTHPGSGYQPKRSKRSPKAPPAKPNGAGDVGHILSRDEILDADDLRTERVPMPEWGGVVLVRAVSLAEREAFEREAGAGDSDNGTVIARVVAMATVDAEGRPLFTPQDVVALAAKGAAPVMRLSQVAMRLNGLVASDIEDLAKN